MILLTGHELFAGNMIHDRWKKLGAPFAAFADFRHTLDLDALAEATQATYLDLPHYWEWRDSRRKGGVARPAAFDASDSPRGKRS